MQSAPTLSHLFAPLNTTVPYNPPGRRSKNNHCRSLVPINRTALAYLSIFFIMFFDGCSRKTDAPSLDASSIPTKATRRVTLKEVQPIFSTKCIACHNPNGMDEGVPMGGLVLLGGRSAENLINAPSIESPLVRVSPGDLAKSYVYHKLHGSFAAVGGTGAQMPLGGTLPPGELALIDDWILSGAPVE